MSGLSGFFFKKSWSTTGTGGLEEIFPFAYHSHEFISCDAAFTYAKILTDTLERISGLSDIEETLFWDNFLEASNTEGLVSLLAQALTDKADLFIVYSPSVNVLRKATHMEADQIKKDYEERGESSVGAYLSFKNYRRSDMLKVYSSLEYGILASFHKTINLAKATQLKMNDMRASVALTDASVAIAQAKAVADALRNGKDVLLDAKDVIENASPDITPTEKAIMFLNSKRAYILGMPMAYISGLQTGGIGSTGEADTKAVERGLKQYFYAILKPAIKSIFKKDVEFVTQDFRQVTSALELLKTFDLVSDDYLSRKSKQEIAARMFEVDPKEELRALKKEAKEDELNPPDNERESEDEDDSGDAEI